MPDFVDVSYAQTGDSLSTNPMGMRDMQAKAFAEKEVQYRLSKPCNHFCSDQIKSITYGFLGKKYRNKQACYPPFILPVVTVQSPSLLRGVRGDLTHKCFLKIPLNPPQQRGR